MTLAEYIQQIKTAISKSKIINSYSMIDERILLNRGYFRARLTLINEDFLEIAEAFAIINKRIVTLSYRYQWMDKTKAQLRKRWGNVEDFPNLANFPHHAHI